VSGFTNLTGVELEIDGQGMHLKQREFKEKDREIKTIKDRAEEETNMGGSLFYLSTFYFFDTCKSI